MSYLRKYHDSSHEHPLNQYPVRVVLACWDCRVLIDRALGWRSSQASMDLPGQLESPLWTALTAAQTFIGRACPHCVPLLAQDHGLVRSLDQRTNHPVWSCSHLEEGHLL